MPRWTKSAAITAVALNILFIICPLMKTTRDKKQLNGKEGTVHMVKGAQTPPKSANATKSPQQETQEA